VTDRTIPEDIMNDEKSQRSRVALCGQLNSAFSDYGYKLFLASQTVAGGTTGAQDQDVKNLLEQVLGLSCVVQIAAELGSACVQLLQSDQYYASYALVRQLVECEYLCRAFAQDQDEARKWIETSRAERLRFWSPKHMRDRSEGEFRHKDYAVHCELGGHPTPRAFQLLHATRSMRESLIWLELTIHLSNVWSHTTRAIPNLIGPLLDRRPGPQGRVEDVTRAVNGFLASDPLLQIMSQLPDFPDLQ
jgi:hypothetical protein